MKTRDAVKHFGTEAEVARVCKVSRQAVNNWGRAVPIKQAWKLQRASKGKLTIDVRDYR